MSAADVDADELRRLVDQLARARWDYLRPVHDEPEAEHRVLIEATPA